MRKIIIIPARIQSERLPEKPLRLIKNKPMIKWTFDAGIKSSADKVQVATDSVKISKLFNSKDIVMTSADHNSGTDRVYEAVAKLGLNDNDVIINLQGDEPFIDPDDLNNLFDIFSKKNVSMATLYSDLISKSDINNPNIVKVVVRNGIALNFFRNTKLQKNLFIHQGVYAFKYKILKNFISWKPSENEKNFKLEQFRAMDNGVTINVLKSVSEVHLGVDTEEDLNRANEIAKENNY